MSNPYEELFEVAKKKLVKQQPATASDGEDFCG